MARDSKETAAPQPPMYESHEERYKEIAGNASDHVKQALAIGLNVFMGGGRGFADAIGGRLRIVSADVFRKADEPEKLEGKVVCEIDVEQDMVNGGGNVHGGCSAYLIDLCSTLPIIALSQSTERGGNGGVSQVIDVVYHSPARIGDRLRIVSTTMSLGTRAMSARCEIWNKTHHRLVATGVHIKMDPSPAKL
ncbi:uncharacterized protein FOMMEDRAFT_105485 [Fomitiporia mediterranea MF3/22]|uniref:uncharacterized protein n=1 Tax=Fomitiporia mediterranea (strain MF3/22) TaxID=694068 RepID=UPI0004408D53|nr:uncharacterized protein FOMMEDRAFT_105485 [Fomitiporia mediterranea MF3/22]EJD05257.1 hypothetical protein FOMMEDRAFT_105485 [Fomitiporia mediterranea MF3/22]